MIFIAFYKYKTPVTSFKTLRNRVVDAVISLITNSPYSHCELAVATGYDKDGCPEFFDIYSSSPRDGGVRVKHNMQLPSERWDLLRLNCSAKHGIAEFYKDHKHCKYDFRGVLGVVFPWLGHNPKKYFCSEFVAEFLGVRNPHKISPANLYSIFSKKVK